MAFVHNGPDIDDDEDDLGVPGMQFYKSHSSGIVDVLSKLLEKAPAQLNASRETVAHAAHHLAFKPSHWRIRVKMMRKRWSSQTRRSMNFLHYLLWKRVGSPRTWRSLKLPKGSNAASAQVARDHEVSVAAFVKATSGGMAACAHGVQQSGLSTSILHRSLRRKEQAESQAETNGNLSKKAAGSKNRTAQRDAVVAEEQQKLAEKALENQAEVEAIHVEEDVTCGTAASNRHCAERHG